MIVLPKNIVSHKYFAEFISKDAETLGLPRSVPMVPWEDLIEH